MAFLRSLNLSTYPLGVGVRGIGALAGLSNLQHLDLSRTLLEGVLPMLPACTASRRSSSPNNQLLNPGELQALLIGLKSSRTTPSLAPYVSYCNLPAELLAELAGARRAGDTGGEWRGYGGVAALLHRQDSAAVGSPSKSGRSI